MSFADIFAAAKEGAVEDVKYFVEQEGIDVNVRDDGGWTLLHYAAKDNLDVEVLKYFISQGADVDAKAKGNADFTPLAVAAYKGRVEAVNVLISGGADVNAKAEGGTPLHGAAMDGHIEVAKILISAGANVDSQSWDGTPLHAAAYNGHIEFVKLLISEGADVSAKNNNNLTPLDFAKSGGNTALVEYLASEVTAKELALDDELSEIEAVVSEYEKKIKDGRCSVENLKREIEKIADPNTLMTKMQANDTEWLAAWKKETVRLSEVDKINVGRLHELKNQYPDDSRIPKIGNRAVKCFLELTEISLSVSERMVSSDLRPQIQASNREIMNGLRNVYSTMFLYSEENDSGSESQTAQSKPKEYVADEPKTSKSDLDKAREELAREKQNLQGQLSRLNQPQSLQSSVTEELVVKSKTGNKIFFPVIGGISALSLLIVVGIWLFTMMPSHEVHYNAGKAHLEAERYSEALEYFSKAIKSMPGVAQYHYLRGVAYLNGENYSEAIADFTEAIRLAPGNAQYHFDRASAHYSRKDYDRTIADYTEAIKLDPNDARYHNSRGNAFRIKEDYDRAIADHTAAIRLNPNDARYHNNRGVAYLLKKNYDNAIVNYAEAIRLAPNNAMYRYNRGEAYRLKRDFAPAIEDFTEAVRLDPNNRGYRSVLERTKSDQATATARGGRGRR